MYQTIQILIVSFLGHTTLISYIILSEHEKHKQMVIKHVLKSAGRHGVSSTPDLELIGNFGIDNLELKFATKNYIHKLIYH